MNEIIERTYNLSVPEHESHVMTFHEPLSWNHLKINLKKFEMKETIERTSN